MSNISSIVALALVCWLLSYNTFCSADHPVAFNDSQHFDRSTSVMRDLLLGVT